MPTTLLSGLSVFEPGMDTNVRELERRAGENCFAPKGQEILAQGFNPGFVAAEKYALKVASEGSLFLHGATRYRFGHERRIWCPFRARRLEMVNPGLKPWANIYRPFGRRWISSNRAASIAVS